MAKKITLESLAVMISDGFAKTATKEELSSVEQGLKQDLQETRETLSNAIKNLEMHLSASSAHSSEELSRLKDKVEYIDERLHILEESKQKHKK